MTGNSLKRTFTGGPCLALLLLTDALSCFLPFFTPFIWLFMQRTSLYFGHIVLIPKYVCFIANVFFRKVMPVFSFRLLSCCSFRFPVTVIWILACIGETRDGAREQGMAQSWERSPPTSVARVQIPASTPYVGWVCCWFSPLLQEVFLQVLRFSPLLKNQHFQIPVRPGIR